MPSQYLKGIKKTKIPILEKYFQKAIDKGMKKRYNYLTTEILYVQTEFCTEGGYNGSNKEGGGKGNRAYRQRG